METLIDLTQEHVSTLDSGLDVEAFGFSSLEDASREAKLKLNLARHIACTRHPYFTSAYLAMRMIEVVPKKLGKHAERYKKVAQDDQAQGGLDSTVVTHDESQEDSSVWLETMAVDKNWNLYWNTEFVLSNNSENVATIWWHELEHLLRNHCSYVVDSQSHLDNVAKDLEINDDIVASLSSRMPDKSLLSFEEAQKSFSEKAEKVYAQGKTIYGELLGMRNKVDEVNFLRVGYMVPEKFKFPDWLLAGEYARLLREMQKNESENNKSGESENQSQGNLDKQLRDYVMSNSGSGSDGKTRPWEKPGAGEKSENDLRKGLSEMDKEMVKRDVANSVKRHVATKGIGSVPDWIKTWSDGILMEQPQPEWKRILRTQVVKAISISSQGRQIRSFSRANRHNGPGTKIYIPGSVDSVLNLGIILDTSGSMGQEDYREALTEIAGVMRTYGKKLNVKMCNADTEIKKEHIRKLKSWNELTRPIPLIGGGGTDMGEALLSYEKIDRSVDIILILTDGYTPWHNPSDRVHKDVPYIVGITNDDVKEDSVPDDAFAVLFLKDKNDKK